MDFSEYKIVDIPVHMWRKAWLKAAKDFMDYYEGKDNENCHFGLCYYFLSVNKKGITYGVSRFGEHRNWYLFPVNRKNAINRAELAIWFSTLTPKEFIEICES